MLAPAELIAGKTLALARRRGRPKSGTDWRDLALLLLKFPEFKRKPHLIEEKLKARGAEAAVLHTWKELAAQKILPERDEDEF